MFSRTAFQKAKLLAATFGARGFLPGSSARSSDLISCLNQPKKAESIASRMAKRHQMSQRIA